MTNPLSFSYKMRLRFPDARVRRLRTTLKLSKAEVARRANLKPSEYAHIEGADRPHWRYGRVRVRLVRRAHVEAVAIVLGTTADFIATGDVKKGAPQAPNDPKRAMFAELQRERRQHASLVRKYERALESKAKQRADDIAYLATLQGDGVAVRWVLAKAVEHMKAGRPARTADVVDETAPDRFPDIRDAI